MLPKNIPFEFVFDYLNPPEITVKPVFGMFYIYKGTRIVLILRNREKGAHLNGIWVATNPGYHEKLLKELPDLTSFSACGKEIPDSGWQLLPAQAENFEQSAIQLCRLVANGDKRIGRVPNEK
jgi:hypothetical protein